jgi:hypothetical protein
MFDFLGGKKDSGRDAGNRFDVNSDQDKQLRNQLFELLNYQDNPDIVDPIKGSRTATNEVASNPILGQLFGEGGALSRTNKEEQDLASRGYSLKPEDFEAYGQGSDQIAREFGQQESGLAQALASRGLSGSNAAGIAFANSAGNKMERLGQLQRQIANDRMKMNLERLGQTRQLLTQLGGQAQNAIGDQFNRQMEGANTQYGRVQDKAAAAQQRMQAIQNQANEQLSQRANTERQQGWASALQGIGNTGEQVGIAALSGGFGGPAKKKPSELSASLSNDPTKIA